MGGFFRSQKAEQIDAFFGCFFRVFLDGLGGGNRASGTVRSARTGSTERGRGEVNLSPGSEGLRIECLVGKDMLLDHLSPRGLVGLVFVFFFVSG